MPKNVYFLEKKAVKLLQRPWAPHRTPFGLRGWGLRPQTPVLSLPLTDINLSKVRF